MTTQTLEQKIKSAGGVLNILRASPPGHSVFPGIPPEFSNWRDEQRAWQHSVVC